MNSAKIIKSNLNVKKKHRNIQQEKNNLGEKEMLLKSRSRFYQWHVKVFPFLPLKYSKLAIQIAKVLDGIGSDPRG